ncbi:MAG: HD domain-containing protein [Candidatus Desulfofervidus auxilii]|nr:HD domain-containing protein [Candidatus Desulfofervidus auxilii]
MQEWIEILKHIALKLNLKEVYLVGGVVRDLLLKRPIQDFDITVEKRPKDIAFLFAKKINGHFVILDEEWETYRVVKDNLYFDFTPFRGKDIISDLSARDYTINALAINIFQPEKIIDPFKGKIDLKNCVLRMVNKKALWEDPLRILRGFRICAELNFDLEKETYFTIKRYAPLLKNIAGERIYQELKRLFLTENASYWIKEMGNSGIFSSILPELDALKGVLQNGFHHLDVYGHSLLTLKQIESLILKPENIILDFKKEIKEYVKEPFHIFCLKWAALCHDLGKPSTQEKKGNHFTFYGHNKVGAELFLNIASRLHFSNKEKDLISFLIIHHLWPFHLLSLYQKNQLTLKAMHRIIRKSEPHTIGLFLLALADNFAANGPGKPKDYDQEFINLFKEIMKIRKEFLSIKERHRLVTGHDIINWFKLKPGPIIGKLLQEIEEAQLAGKIKTKEEAKEWLERKVKEY